MSAEAVKSKGKPFHSQISSLQARGADELHAAGSGPGGAVIIGLDAQVRAPLRPSLLDAVCFDLTLEGHEFSQAEAGTRVVSYNRSPNTSVPSRLLANPDVVGTIKNVVESPLGARCDVIWPLEVLCHDSSFHICTLDCLSQWRMLN
jgi:hypothetical protein